MTGLLLFLAALIALLAMPITLTFRVSGPQAVRNDAELTWAFGLVRRRILPATSGPTVATGRRAARRGDGSRRPTRTTTGVLNTLRDTALRRRIARFVSDLWRAIRKQDVRVRLRIGLGDPADTGQLWAVLGPVSALVGGVHEISAEIEPEFLDEALEFAASGSVSIVPLQMIYLAIALMLSPAVWRAVKRLRAAGP
ncbi:MAG: DUF2953 domain-containing protein [Gammaproteobacteria bacterium]|nr:DUF2953 domain-containing protein [Gammaproteobacteria bacterium]